MGKVVASRTSLRSTIMAVYTVCIYVHVIWRKQVESTDIKQLLRQIVRHDCLIYILVHC